VPYASITDRLRQVTHREVPGIAHPRRSPMRLLYHIDAIARLALIRT
jgi:hypothetical protein